MTDMLDSAVDPYIAMRNAYLQSRQSAIQDGDEPAVIPASSMLDPFAEDDEPDTKAEPKKDGKK